MSENTVSEQKKPNPKLLECIRLSTVPGIWDLFGRVDPPVLVLEIRGTLLVHLRI